MTSKNKLKNKIKKLERGLKSLERQIDTINTNYDGLSFILISMIGTYDKNMGIIQRTFEEIVTILSESNNKEEDNAEETDTDNR